MQIKQETVNIIDYSDLERFIDKIYNLGHMKKIEGTNLEIYEGYSIPATEEIGENHLVYYPYWAEDDELVDNPLNVTLNTPLHDIMVDLFRKGLLKEGKYLIDVSW